MGRNKVPSEAECGKPFDKDFARCWQLFGIGNAILEVLLVVLALAEEGLETMHVVHLC